MIKNIKNINRTVLSLMESERLKKLNENKSLCTVFDPATRWLEKCIKLFIKKKPIDWVFIPMDLWNLDHNLGNI